MPLDDGFFSDHTGGVGLGATSRMYTRFGTGLVDFDNDGVLDLFQAPPDARFIGPLVHVYEQYETFDGLVIPTKYSTYAPDGQIYGRHTVKDVSFTVPFDASKVVMPDNAVVDTSDPDKRASAQK